MTRIRFFGVAAYEIITSGGKHILIDPFLNENPGSPVKGEDRYFVVTQWESEEAFQAWATGPAIEAHAGHRANPVATGASLLEFEVVLDVAGTGPKA